MEKKNLPHHWSSSFIFIVIIHGKNFYPNFVWMHYYCWKHVKCVPSSPWNFFFFTTVITSYIHYLVRFINLNFPRIGSQTRQWNLIPKKIIFYQIFLLYFTILYPGKIISVFSLSIRFTISKCGFYFTLIKVCSVSILPYFYVICL